MIQWYRIKYIYMDHIYSLLLVPAHCSGLIIHLYNIYQLFPGDWPVGIAMLIEITKRIVSMPLLPKGTSRYIATQ